MSSIFYLSLFDIIIHKPEAVFNLGMQQTSGTLLKSTMKLYSQSGLLTIMFNSCIRSQTWSRFKNESHEFTVFQQNVLLAVRSPLIFHTCPKNISVALYMSPHDMVNHFLSRTLRQQA